MTGYIECNKQIILGFKLVFFSDHYNFKEQDSNALCLECVKEQNFAIDLLEHQKVLMNKEIPLNGN